MEGGSVKFALALLRRFRRARRRCKLVAFGADWLPEIRLTCTVIFSRCLRVELPGLVRVTRIWWVPAARVLVVASGLCR